MGRYLLALLLTLVIELPVAHLIGPRGRRYTLAVAMANVLTHPALNYAILVLDTLGVYTFAHTIALEVVVVVVEWLLLVYAFGRPKGRFLLVSLVANAASFIAGLLLSWS